MAKTIKITFYSPKELWAKFWQKFFWPRRKECSDWMDYAKGAIESDLADVFVANKKMIVEEYYDSDELYNLCMRAIKERLDFVKEMMCTPL